MTILIQINILYMSSSIYICNNNKNFFMDFICCEIGDGKTTFFWFDVWTEFGILISYIGEIGHSLLRVRKDARVIEATRHGQWHMPTARTEEIQNFLISFTDIIAPNENKVGCDKFLWRTATCSYTQNFSSKDTWKQLRVPSPIVSWAKVTWFAEGVPRFSFFTWLGIIKRLLIRDRLRRWGVNVPQACVLCPSQTESHEHLFFDCVSSSGILEILRFKDMA